MRVDEAREALERAGYIVVDATMAEDVSRRFVVSGFDGTYLADELVKLAHRHGAWRPAVERSHSAGPRQRNGKTRSHLAIDEAAVKRR